MPFLMGHGDGPPPPPGPPDPGALVDAAVVYPQRWSWLHWWEANRGAYLQPLRQGGPLQARDEETMATLRQRAIATLIEQSSSRFEGERAAAAVALGRIGEAQGLEVLGRLAEEDSSELVRFHAIVGLGMIGGAEAEAAIADLKLATDLLRRAALAGVGLLESPGPAMLAGLRRTVLEPDAQAATIAVWSLRRHAAGENAALLRNIATSTPSLWLASESLAAMGDSGDAGSMALLIDVLAAGRRAWRVPAYARLAQLDIEKNWLVTFGRIRAGTYEQRYQNYVKQIEVYQKNFNPNVRAVAQGAPVRGTIVLGEEKIFMSRLRATAAIALERFERREAVAALMNAVREADDGYNDLPRGMAVMSLGRLGATESLALLLDVLGPVDRRNDVLREHVLRGYAALALGLYARPYATAQGLADRPGFERSLQKLQERLADPRETQEVRCACAVALGLSGRTSALKALSATGSRLTTRDELLGGYVLLGRGMLGDRNIVAHAGDFLRLENDRPDMPGILARRAAVLGLGLCGADEAIPVLTEAWHLNYYVNREVVLALAIAGALSVADIVIGEIRGQATPPERAFFAAVLGELLAAEQPGRIDAFVGGSNYTIRDDGRLPFQRLANEFMYAYLLQAFGDTWQ